jgi:Ca-activated chloride channel homolog
MRLAEPIWLSLLVLVPLPWLLSRLRPRASWPTLGGFGKTTRRFARSMGFVPLLVRAAAIACLAVAIARPQTVAGRTRIAGQGVAIMVALDQSSSMNTEDFPSGDTRVARLRAAKETLTRFIAGRPDDLIGLVVFANYPDLVSPTTLDHAFLTDVVRAVRTALPGDDGTNLGDAIVLGLDAIKAAPQKKKLLILMTDGRNAPAVPKPADPLVAATIARKLGVTVHTIAVGKAEPNVPGEPADADGPDLALLTQVAEAGGGQSFVATDADALDRIFTTINTLEKSPVRGEVRTRYRELYTIWAASALGLLAFERWLSAGRFRRLP